MSSLMQSKLVQFNESKCKVMLISRKTTRSIVPLPLVLNGSLLQRVHSYKYLGITISCDLSWKPHITSVCNKTRKCLVFCTDVSLQMHRVMLWLNLYTSFIRPSLEYASIDWSPYLKGKTYYALLTYKLYKTGEILHGFATFSNFFGI